MLLPYKSRRRQAHNFNGDMAATPSKAITMGVATMLSAKKVILMAWGEDKADMVQQIVECKNTPDYPASFFQKHQDVTLYVDENSSAKLTRVVAPWLIGPCEWTKKFRRKAVIWLCEQVHKPILKLGYQDYLQNGLGELLENFGPYDKVNIEVFNELQHTITGWPGGKPNADDSTRPVPSSPYPKKVVIFSPHPDDDVISMGGTFIRLAHQGHDVHVAYETSGNVAVHDDVVLQHMDAARELGFGDRFDEVKALVASKVSGAKGTARTQGSYTPFRSQERVPLLRAQRRDQCPLPQSSVLRVRRYQEAASLTGRCGYHQESASEDSASDGIYGRRPCRPSRHSPSLHRMRP